jgi:hypothetical protein
VALLQQRDDIEVGRRTLGVMPAQAQAGGRERTNSIASMK